MLTVAVALMMFALLSPQAITGTAVAQQEEQFGCPGDCNYDGRVAMSELITAVRRGIGRPTMTNCVAAERQCDGEISVDDLVAAVTAANTRCANSPTTPDGLPLGVYDATTTVAGDGPTYSTQAVAAVDSRFAPLEMRLRIDLLTSAYVFGAFSDSGAVCAEGSLIDGEIFFPLSGRLQYDGQGTVTGSVQARRWTTGDDLSFDIDTTRDAGEPALHEGTYTLRVEYLNDGAAPRVTTWTLPIAGVDGLGFGTCGPAVERDAGAMPVAQIAAGRCWISPRGGIEFFSAEYLPVDPQGCVAPVRFLGGLTPVLGASGEFYVGLPMPACSLSARWQVVDHES